MTTLGRVTLFSLLNRRLVEHNVNLAGGRNNNDAHSQLPSRIEVHVNIQTINNMEDRNIISSLDAVDLCLTTLISLSYNLPWGMFVVIYLLKYNWYKESIITSYDLLIFVIS